MHSFNVLIAGSGKCVPLIKNSALLNKLYITSAEIEGAITINFNTFQELAKKCKALQIDIVVVEYSKWIMQGIANVMKKNFINCIAPSIELIDICSSSDSLENFGIAVPKILAFPSKFPLVVKAKGINKVANSFEEIFEIKQKIDKLSPEIRKTVHLEEFIDGDSILLPSIYDGKTVVSFYEHPLIEDYTNKLTQMFNHHKLNCIGFITSKLIVAGDTLYNTGFTFDFPNFNSKQDLLYVLDSAIYQKLNEISLI